MSDGGAATAREERERQEPRGHEGEGALPRLTIEDLLEAGVHFGHHSQRWNPKMSRYIFGERNGIHIMDLTQTLPLMERALRAIRDVVRRTGRILFVGTKPQAASVVAEAAKRCAQYYVNRRWLGGTLTNWKTIASSIQRLKRIEDLVASGMDGYTKREQTKIIARRDRLMQTLGGIKDMGGTPDMVFVIDVNRDFIAVQEAQRLGIPVVAILDSNSDPDGVDYPVPGNDDAARAIQYYCDRVVEAAIAGISGSLQTSGDHVPGDVDGAVAAEFLREKSVDGARSRGDEKGDGAASSPEPEGGPKSEGGGDMVSGRKVGGGGAVETGEVSGGSSAPVSAQDVKALRQRTGAGFMECKKALIEAGGDLEGSVDILRKRGLSRAAERAGREASQGLVALSVCDDGSASMVELNCETDFVARNEKFQALIDGIMPLVFAQKGCLDAVLSAPAPEGFSGSNVHEVLAHAVASIGENIALRRVVYFPCGEDEVVGSYVHGQIVPQKGQIGSLVLVGSSRPGSVAKDKLRALADNLAVHVAASDVRSISVESLDPDLVARERAIAQEQSRASGKPDAVVAKMVEGRLKKFYAEVVLMKQSFVFDQGKSVEEVVREFEKENGSSEISVRAFVKFRLGEVL